MLLNVWALIWPNQKKISWAGAGDRRAKEQGAAGGFSRIRTNTALSIPMLFFMVAQTHIPM